MDQFFENNRKLWNRRTALHKESDFYDLKGFEGGGSSLKQLEIKELGAVSGKSMLHLQCHFGLDSLSWEKLGAEVTGVDFSDAAIELACQIREKHHFKTQFVKSDIYQLKQHQLGQFDIVFTSYGVLCWLPDLKRWANIINHHLKPGGVFYIVEFHPVVMMYHEVTGNIEYPYFHHETPFEQEVEYTYANKHEVLKHKEFSWNHSLADVLNALISNGLEINHLNEFPYSSYNCFADLEVGEDGYYWDKRSKGSKPLMFSILATKKLL